MRILIARRFVLDRTEGSHQQWKGSTKGKPRLVTIDQSIDEYHRELLKTVIHQSGLSRDEFYCSTKASAKKINKKVGI